MKKVRLATLLLAAALPLPAHAQVLQQQTLQFSAGVPEFNALSRIDDKLYVLSTSGVWAAAQTFDAHSGTRLAQVSAEVRPTFRHSEVTVAGISLLRDGFGAAFALARIDRHTGFPLPPRQHTRIVSTAQEVLGEHYMPDLVLSNGDAIYCDRETISRTRGVGGAVEIVWKWPSNGPCRLDFDRLLSIETAYQYPGPTRQRFAFRDLQTGAVSAAVEVEAASVARWSVARNVQALLVASSTHLRALRIDSGEMLWSQTLGPGEQLLGESVGLGVLTRTDSQLCRRDLQSGAQRWCVARRSSEAHQILEGPRVVVGTTRLTANVPGAGMTLLLALDLDTGAELWRRSEPEDSLFVLGDEIALSTLGSDGLSLALSDPRTGLLTRRLLLDSAVRIPGRLQAVRLPSQSPGIQDLLLRKGAGRDSEALRLATGRERFRVTLPGGNRDDLSWRGIPRRLLTEPIFELYRRGQAYNREALLDPESGALLLQTDSNRFATIDRAGNGDWLISTLQSAGGERLERFAGSSLQPLASVNFPTQLVRAREGGLVQFACGTGETESCVLSTDQAKTSARKLADTSVIWQGNCANCFPFEIHPLRALARAEPPHLLVNQSQSPNRLEGFSPLDGVRLFGTAAASFNAQFQYDGQHYLVASQFGVERRSALNGLQIAVANGINGEVLAFDSRFQRALIGMLRLNSQPARPGPASQLAPMTSALTLDTQSYAPLSETLLQIGDAATFAVLPLVDQVSVDSGVSGRVLHSGAGASGQREYALATVALQPEPGNVTLGARYPLGSTPTWRLCNDSLQTRTLKLVSTTSAKLVGCYAEGVSCPDSLPALVTLLPQATLHFRLAVPHSPNEPEMVIAYPVSHPTESQLGDNLGPALIASFALLIDSFE